MFKHCLVLFTMMSSPGWAGDVCTFDAAGRCEEPPSADATLEPAVSARVYRYGAIVAGLSNGDPSHGVPARVATGAAQGTTAARAIAAARTVCEAERPGIICGVIRTFTDGCSYVAKGTRGTQARYAAGQTWDEAVANCQRGGFTCRAKEVGICVGDDIEENETGE